MPSMPHLQVGQCPGPLTIRAEWRLRFLVHLPPTHHLRQSFLLSNRMPPKLWPGFPCPEVPRYIVFFVFLFFNLFIYFCLRWVFVAARGLSLVAASGGYS